MLEADFAVMHKTRPAHEQAAVTEVTGRVRDKVCIVGDDVTTTGGTLSRARGRSASTGAREVWVYVTHALLSGEGSSGSPAPRTSRASSSPTPSRSTRGSGRRTSTVLTVSPLLAETIINVFSDDSVSAIFGGENQLF